MKKTCLMSGFTTMVLALALAACASLPKPETTAQRIAVAEATFTALVEEATHFRQAGYISDADAPRISHVIMAGDRLLDLAWEAERVGDARLAAERLTGALNLIAELERLVEIYRG